MEGALPIIFLAVVLKIPVFFGIWLRRRDPRGPRPRRDPHGGAARPLPDCPPGGRRRVTAPGRPLPVLTGHERRRERTPDGA
jgi:hypothetical protein